MVHWDAIPDADEGECEYPVRLLPSKWNPKTNHSRDSWRLDVHVKKHA